MLDASTARGLRALTPTLTPTPTPTLTPTPTQTLKPWLSLQTHVRALLRKADRVGVVPDAPSTQKVAAYRLTLALPRTRTRTRARTLALSLTLTVTPSPALSLTRIPNPNPTPDQGGHLSRGEQAAGGGGGGALNLT